MYARIITALLLSLLVLGRGWAAEKNKTADKAPEFSLAPAGSEANTQKFNEAQLAFVQSWIKQKAPECPPAAAGAVAELFLEELRQHSPQKFDQLLTGNFVSADYESMLLRQVAVKLTGSTQGPLREELARRRVGAFLAAGNRDIKAVPGDAAGLIAKIKDAFPSQHRRLVEGKMDDDDLELLLKKSRQAGTAPKEAAPAKPKVLTAADIVAEYSRRNQTGSAVQRLQAYSVEGKLKTGAGEKQELMLFKLRPDRFRLVVRTAGLSRYILSGDGSQFWQQSAGQEPQIVPAEKMGSRIYLSEFTDPLFGGEGYTFERREDGEREGRKFHRIAVHRPDGSGYVTCIDTETFHEIGRENDDKSVSRYSDFREVGGITYAFREEVVDQNGKKGTFEVVRIAPNPGLIQEFFNPPTRQGTNYFQLEQLMGPTAAATGKPNP